MTIAAKRQRAQGSGSQAAAAEAHIDEEAPNFDPEALAPKAPTQRDEDWWRGASTTWFDYEELPDLS